MHLLNMFLLAPFLLLDASVPAVGFNQAHLDAGTLRELLGDRECTGVRVYNVQLDNGQGSAMVIGIRADGTEINGGLFANPYKASAMSTADPLAVVGLSRNQAESACRRMAESGVSSRSASLSSADLQALLNLPGCTGVRIEPMEGNGGTSFQLTAVTVDRGSVQPVGGEGSTRLCGDPCPMVCGPPTNYINAAQLK